MAQDVQRGPPCQDEACSLQACLNKNTYSPNKCDAQVRKLYECCKQMYKYTGGKGESTACPNEQVVERWLKKHGNPGTGS